MTPLLFLLATASATEITVTAADGQTAVVLVDQFVKGETPVITDVDGGEVTLGFRSSMFGPVLFSQTVTVPTSGSASFVVDVDARTVTSGAADPVIPPSPVPEPAPAVVAKTLLQIPLEGVAISLNGTPTGKTGPATLDVDPGRHDIELADGCSSGAITVTAEAGETTVVEAPMTPARFIVSVGTDPSGAEVLVDGDMLGKTPIDAKLSCGAHTVKVMKEGWFATEQVLDVDGDERVDLTLEKEAFGSVEITVQPSNATIKLDGEKVGTGSVTLDAVRAGSHELTIERKGEVLETRTLNVKDGAEMVLSLVVSDTGKPGKTTRTPPADPEGPDTEKPPRDRPARRSAGRLVLNSLVTAGAAPLAVLGFYNYGQARVAYDDYQAMPDGDARDTFYREQVVPRQTVAFIEWGAAGALLATGTTLWITSLVDSPVTIAPTRNGVQLGGRF